MLGLPVNAPQQDEAASERQEGGAHRGSQDPGHDPGGGDFCRDKGLGHVLVRHRLADSDRNTIFTITIQW